MYFLYFKQYCQTDQKIMQVSKYIIIIIIIIGRYIDYFKGSTINP